MRCPNLAFVIVTFTYHRTFKIMRRIFDSALHLGRYTRHQPVARCVTSSGPQVSTGCISSNLVLIPLPKLAPHMKSGRINWLKAPGEAFLCYDIVAEVTTSTLVEEAHREGEFAGEVTLLLEAQEDGYLACTFHSDPSKTLPVGTLIGILCEEEAELPETMAVATASDVKKLPKDLYDPEVQQKWRIWNGWQAYLKKGDQE